MNSNDYVELIFIDGPLKGTAKTLTGETFNQFGTRYRHISPLKSVGPIYLKDKPVKDENFFHCKEFQYEAVRIPTNSGMPQRFVMTCTLVSGDLT